MNDTDRVTSDHMLHSTAETHDIDAEFAAEMRAQRAYADCREYIHSPAVTLHDAAPLAEAQAAKFAAHVATVQPQLDAQCAALLAQHNADVDQRKANGEQRRNGNTYMDRLEAAQREGKV